MLTAFPVPAKDKSRRLCEAFVRGAPKSAEGFVFYGVKATNRTSWDYVRRYNPPGGRDWYWIDNSYFDATRGQRFRVTKNALQVSPLGMKSDERRFEELGIEIAPWTRAANGHWVVVHQSVDHEYAAPGHAKWLAEVVGHLSCGGEKFIHRQWARDKPSLMQTLPADLVGARGLITHTSAAAVQAVISGVQCIVSNMHALSGMTCGYENHSHLDDRRHFLSVLADHEFTLNELEDGTAWSRLNP